MTTVPASASTTAQDLTTTTSLTRPRRVVFRTGVVLTVLMGTMNTLNGGSALLGLQPSAGGAGWILFAIGFPTLLLAGTAWRPVPWALRTVIALRVGEALSFLVPFGADDWYQAPDRRGFYLQLAALSLVVAGLMAAGLQRRRR